MSWINLIDNWAPSLNEWSYTPVVNDARFFKLSHNISNNNNQVIGQLAQADITNPDKVLLFDQKRFLFTDIEQIFQFNKPSFLINRVLALQITDLRISNEPLNPILKIEYSNFAYQETDNEQLNRIEERVNNLVNRPLIYGTHIVINAV